MMVAQVSRITANGFALIQRSDRRNAMELSLVMLMVSPLAAVLLERLIQLQRTTCQSELLAGGSRVPF